MSPARTRLRSAAIVGTAATLFAMAVTACIAVWFEARFYESLAAAEILGERTIVEEGVIVWIIWAKSLSVVLPVLLMTTVAAWLGWRRTAWAVFLAGMTGLTYWLFVDVLVQATTGNHVLDYWPAVLNAGSWESIGRDQVAAMQRRLLILFLAIAVPLGIVLYTCRFLGRRIEHRTGTRLAVGLWIGSICLYLAAMFGVGPARQHLLQSMNSQAVARSLELYLPVMPLLLPDGPSAERGKKIAASVLADYDTVRDSLFQARPVDDRPVIPADKRPHILILIMESLRHHMISPQFMKRLHAWSGQGLRFQRHYAASNCSHYGLFSVLYGRSPLVYDHTLDAQVSPQMCHSLRKGGYEAWYLTGFDERRHCRMGEFLNERTFDHVVENLEGDWPTRDRQTMARVREILARSHGRPQFVVAFLVSTHHDYAFPKEYARHKPYVENLDLLGGQRSFDRNGVANRYWNAADFLDDQAADLVETLDPAEHLVIVTGDHGESFFDDGTFTHASKLSEIQTRVPLVIVGAGCQPRSISQATTHLDILPTILHVLNGRSVPLAHAHGRSALEPLPASRVLLVQALLDQSGSHERDRVLFIDDPWRMEWLLYRNRSAARLLGFVDEKAQFVFDRAPSDEEATRLASDLMEKLRQFAE